ncbi:MAG: SRPBCC family protein [Myxococcota bacterium]
MSRFFITETIARPLPEVWAFATDWSNATSWMQGVDTLRLDGDGPTQQGSELVFEARGKERRSTIVRWDPPNSFELKSVQGNATANYTYRFEAIDDDTTKAQLWGVCEFRGALKLMGPLLRWIIAKSDGGQMRDLAAAMKDG